MTSSTRTSSVRTLTRAVAVLVIVAACLAAYVSAAGRASAATPRVASQSTTAKNNARMSRALNYAITQKGDPYRYGATGPNAWDCSSLVQWAYRKAGVKLPRTTYDMLKNKNKRLHRVSRSWALAHRGTLAFHGSGHVEMVSSSKYKFGARRTGTRVGFTSWYDLPGWKFYAVY